MSIGKLEHVSAASGLKLAVQWDDGRTASIDLSKVIAARKNLAPLADSATFGAVSLSGDGWSVEWPCGIDFGAQQLRRLADEQAGETMSSADFRRWMDGHAMTLERAAEALGLSRRTIAYYLSGEQAIPKTVLLATEGFDRRRAA